MAFVQNQFSSNNNTQTEEKKKTNFRVGKIYCTDGTIDVSVWNSDKGGCYAILSIKAAVGKDPSTGANVYEQKMSGELPSICMNIEIVRALIDAVKGADPGTLNINIDTKRGAKMSMVGSGGSVKITIDNQKTGSRTVTLDSISVGPKNIHANFNNLMDMINICFKKAIHNKLDAGEFAVVFGENSEEVPF